VNAVNHTVYGGQGLEILRPFPPSGHFTLALSARHCILLQIAHQRADGLKGITMPAGGGREARASHQRGADASLLSGERLPQRARPLSPRTLGLCGNEINE
jgi:hypothetical protein